MLRPNQKVFVALAALLLCTFSTSLAETEANDSFNCPEDCQCVIPPNTQHTFLHAKCKSLNGLKTKAPLQTTLPIHSIDLSYLRLTRLSHSLDKLHDLTSIDLSHNELHEIGHLGRRIKKLNLKGNRITSGKLLKLPHHLQVLNLQHNDITYLPLEFMNFKNLHTLELSHNQINCSCETLEVRNWLQQRHVFMEHPVKCSYPVEVKGQSWLQVKQAHICEQEKQGWNADQDENELMMGDQPMEGSGDEDEEDELGKAYMPIDKKPTSTKSNELNDVEGSGDLGEMNMPLRNELSTENPIEATTEVIDDVDGDDGSGSGAGILIALHSDRDSLINHDFHYPTNTEKEHDSNHDDSFDNKPIEEPQVEPTQSPDIFGAGMGIFDGAEDNDDKTNDEVDEEIIVPAIYRAEGAAPEANSDAAIIDDGIDTETKSENIERAEVGAQDDNNATYFLLGVIVLIVVGLFLFVGIKRCKNKNNANDPENPRQTELLDMDKKNLGKPLQRNGNEQVPLIGEKSKSDMAKPINGADKKPYDSNDVKDGHTQQPLLNGNGNTNGTTSPADEEIIPKINEPLNENAPHQYYPITPRYPTPKSPRASKYAQYPANENNNNNNNNNVDDAYLPSSPKSGRYSPVYSPETGRVKIKLTETPKPKTPMLVTRSKSNAGDFVTTPVTDSVMPAVHVGGVVNGHVDH